jgi:hypothetical protein
MSKACPEQSRMGQSVKLKVKMGNGDGVKPYGGANGFDPST